MYVQCRCMLEVCDLHFNFVLQGVTDCQESQKKLLNGVESVIGYGDFLSWTEYIFALWYGYKLMGARKYNVMV